MKIYLTTLSLMLLMLVPTHAEEIRIGMSLETARKILKQSDAKELVNSYHFPWTAKFYEVRQRREGESLEDYNQWMKSQIEANAKKKSGYSLFFSLADKTRLELVLEIDNMAKRICCIRIGEDRKIYEDKFAWIEAGENGKIKKFKSLDPTRRK